jgi:hypothetical protein
MTNSNFSADLNTLLNSYQSVTTLEEIHLLAPFLINVNVLELKASSDSTIQNSEVRKGIYPNLGMWMSKVFKEYSTNNYARMELFTAARELAILKYTIIKNMDLKAEIVKAESQELINLQQKLEELKKENLKLTEARNNWYNISLDQKNKLKELEEENLELFNVYIKAKTFSEVNIISNKEGFKTSYSQLKDEVLLVNKFYNV